MSESLKQCAVVLSVGLRQSRTGGTTAPQRDRPCRCFGSEEHLSTRGPRLTFSPLALPAPMATPECAKDLPISRMTKPQLLQECLRLGLTVHHSWSPEEIKAIIMEAREKAKDQDATERMKRISHLNMPELKLKATELGVEFAPSITKGNLLRLVRDSLNTPDNELMKIGKHRGMEFREVPWQYGRWASNEVKTSPNADPELVRFARWWDQNEERKKGYPGSRLEDASEAPAPSSVGTSWESVSPWEASWPKKATSTSSQLPIAPKTSEKANSKRRTQGDEENDMDGEPDQETLEEIMKLETRLAVLKSKAKAKGAGK